MHNKFIKWILWIKFLIEYWNELFNSWMNSPNLSPRAILSAEKFWCFSVPGYQVYLLKADNSDLDKRHQCFSFSWWLLWKIQPWIASPFQYVVFAEKCQMIKILSTQISTAISLISLDSSVSLYSHVHLFHLSRLIWLIHLFHLTVLMSH